MDQSSLLKHTACISFWISKRQAISTENGLILKKNKLKLKYKREKKILQALSKLPANDSAKKAA